jgi:DNA end-binding protein Ku
LTWQRATGSGVISFGMVSIPVKGFEFAKGQFVLSTDEEMKAMDAKSTGGIEIEEFAPADAINAVSVEKVNYLGPDKGAARSYHLLAEAMRQTGKSALAKYAARGKCYLVMIHPFEYGLIMIQLRHQEELRSMHDLEIPPTEL